MRRATPEDAPAVARLLHDFNTEFSDFTPGIAKLTERLRSLLDRDETIALLAGHGSDGLAVLRLRPSYWTGGRHAYLEELYVAPGQRGRGLGRALLGAAIAEARNAGATDIDLSTSDDDTAAIALYESCGFSGREGGPAGPRMRFYERELAPPREEDRRDAARRPDS